MNPLERFFRPPVGNPTKPKAPPAAVPAGAKVPFTLTASDFQGGSPLLSRQSVLASFKVPRGELYELSGVLPFRFGIKAKIEQQAVASSAGGEITVDLGAAGINAVRSTRPAGGPRTHPDVIFIAAPSAGGAAIKRDIKSYDADANTVTAENLTASTNYDLTIYVLHGNGQVILRATQPSGSDVRSIELFNSTFAALHETDQANGQTAPRLGRGAVQRYPLAPKWTVAVEVNSDVTMAWDDEAEHLLNLRGQRMPVSVVDPRTLNALVGGKLS